MGERVDMICPECGTAMQAEGAHKKARSVPQNRRLHALIDELYYHWPERSNVFRPKTREHLRKFLLVQCGHFHLRAPIRVKSTSPEIAYNMLRAVLDDSDNENTFIEIDGDVIHRKVANSTSFDDLDPYDATKLFTEIDAYIEVMGFNAERLLLEAKKRA